MVDEVSERRDRAIGSANGPHIVVLDCGVKRNIVRSLRRPRRAGDRRALRHAVCRHRRAEPGRRDRFARSGRSGQSRRRARCRSQPARSQNFPISASAWVINCWPGRSARKPASSNSGIAAATIRCWICAPARSRSPPRIMASWSTNDSLPADRAGKSRWSISTTESVEGSAHANVAGASRCSFTRRRRPARWTTAILFDRVPAMMVERAKLRRDWETAMWLSADQKRTGPRLGPDRHRPGRRVRLRRHPGVPRPARRRHPHDPRQLQSGHDHDR